VGLFLKLEKRQISKSSLKFITGEIHVAGTILDSAVCPRGMY